MLAWVDCLSGIDLVGEKGIGKFGSEHGNVIEDTIALGDQFEPHRSSRTNGTVKTVSNAAMNPKLEIICALQSAGDEQMVTKGNTMKNIGSSKENMIQQGQMVLKGSTGNELYLV